MGHAPAALRRVVNMDFAMAEINKLSVGQALDKMRRGAVK
jgi:hypothetical protein